MNKAVVTVDLSHTVTMVSGSESESSIGILIGVQGDCLAGGIARALGTSQRYLHSACNLYNVTHMN